MPPSLAVIKVGGSLFDLPDLGSRLRRWLDEDFADACVVLIAGGGGAVDVLRDLDRRHGLGEEAAHWLALRAMTLNAHFLAALLPPARVIGEVSAIGRGEAKDWRTNPLSGGRQPPENRGTLGADAPRSEGLSDSPKNLLSILDIHEFARADEKRAGHLPHCWAVTSDAVAARVAIVMPARHLVLLKSTTIPAGMDWTEAGRLGLVDEMFADVLREAPADLRVRAVNLRMWPRRNG